MKGKFFQIYKQKASVDDNYISAWEKFTFKNYKNGKKGGVVDIHIKDTFNIFISCQKLTML